MSIRSSSKTSPLTNSQEAAAPGPPAPGTCMSRPVESRSTSQVRNPIYTILSWRDRLERQPLTGAVFGQHLNTVRHFAIAALAHQRAIHHQVDRELGIKRQGPTTSTNSAKVRGIPANTSFPSDSI